MTATRPATYVKCACTACTGRIEYPENAEGVSVPCPHCGEVTVLKAPRRELWQRKRVLLPVAFAFILGGGLALGLFRPGSRALQVSTSSFIRAAGDQPGYAVGVITNRLDHPLRGVRIALDLQSSHGEVLWQGSDFTREIPGRGSWQFRAVVLDPAVSTAVVAHITFQ